MGTNFDHSQVPSSVHTRAFPSCWISFRAAQITSWSQAPIPARLITRVNSSQVCQNPCARSHQTSMCLLLCSTAVAHVPSSASSASSYCLSMWGTGLLPTSAALAAKRKDKKLKKEEKLLKRGDGLEDINSKSMVFWLGKNRKPKKKKQNFLFFF